MAVSIWEGSKAQDLIEAITNTQKVDKQQGTGSAGKALIVGSDGLVVTGDAISGSVKTALLKCFRHVAWIDDHGQDYYDELEVALNNGSEPEPEPEWGTDYTWLYRADRDGLLSTNDNISEVVQQGTTPAETVSNNVLNVQVTNGAQIYKINPLDSSNAILKAKVRFNELPSSTAPNGFRMQVSNGTTGAQIFAFKLSGANGYSLRTNLGGDTQQIVLDNIALNQWYIISCELRNGKQIITVDDNATEYNALSAYACTENRIIVQDTTEAGTDVDVAWVTFKDNDTI